MFVVLIVLVLVMNVTSQDYRYCPGDWETFNSHCYQFVSLPYTYDEAKLYCGNKGAALLSVNDFNEHNFISGWLIMNDPTAQRWFTSGMVYGGSGGEMVWKGDGTNVMPGDQFWINQEAKAGGGMHIVYVYRVTDYRWGREVASSKLPFICEISENEAYKITRDDRDYDYGTELRDPEYAPRGPHMLLNPQSIIVVSDTETISFEWVALAYPDHVYKLYQTDDENSTMELVTSEKDSRYTVTNGKLSIQNPTETADAGTYFCTVENEFGSIIGNEMSLTFGFLGEFSNNEREPVTAYSHDHAVIDCGPPTYKPALTYQWWRESTGSFVYTELASYMFISRNGKLYFSVVSKDDEDKYKCVVKLSSNNGAAIGTSQPPSRTSLSIQLLVRAQVESVWGPEFGNDFIAVFPTIPLRGQTVYMECLAYGTMPISYEWTRDALPIPTTATVLDFGRVLMIENVQLEDGGNYTCHASRGYAARAEKTTTLRVEGKPYFSYPLKDKHVDIGSQLTWRCEAKAIPLATYTWYKNGEPLLPLTGEITITRNVLIIQSVDPDRHNGMYQCEATNTHGTSFTEGQLRALALKPSFEKFPMAPTVFGAVNGNVTIACKPEASPFPEFKWLKNGVDLGLTHGNTESSPRLLQNGYLHFTNLRASDSGMYTCSVTNEYGTASMATELSTSVPELEERVLFRLETTPSSPPAQVLCRSSTTLSNQSALKGTSTIDLEPRPVTDVYINNTAFLQCSASVSGNLERVYTWRFNNYDIEFDGKSHYVLGESQAISGLYIRQAQYKHSGTYECVVQTPLDSVTASGRLIVSGPPGPPAAVYADPNTITATSLRLKWTPGWTHGSAILYYTVEGRTDMSTAWDTVIAFISEQDTIAGNTDKRSVMVYGLKSGVGYRFRVTAANAQGIGEKSVQSDVFQTLASVPHKAPDSVGGGGGMVGDLMITWQPLHVDDWGGSDVKYKIYWRLLGSTSEFNEGLEPLADVGVYTLQVGQENYYREYEVKVQAMNDYGDGPMSPVSVIYSAEDMPIAVPQNIQALRYNATAIRVTWDAIPNTRESMRGTLLGYQVNYFERYQNEPIINSISWRTAEPSGLVIGLLPYTWYTFDVQVLNTAGMGPLSEKQHQKTYLDAPLRYPTEVYVHSDGPESVRVSWRGVSTEIDEEPIVGYKIRFWPNGDDIRSARNVEVDKVDSATIFGIEKNILYKVRVLGFSRGGDGNLGETIYFTLGGQVSVDPTVSEVLAGARRPTSSTVITSIAFTVIMMFIHS